MSRGVASKVSICLSCLHRSFSVRLISQYKFDANRHVRHRAFLVGC